MRFEVIWFALENILRFNDGVLDAAGFCVQLGQCRCQVTGSRVGFYGLSIFLNGFVGEITAAIDRYLLFVHVSQSVVIVGCRLIDFAGSRVRRRNGRF